MEAQWKYIARLLPGTVATTFQLALPETTLEQLSEAEPEEIIESEKEPAAAQALTTEEAVTLTTPKGTMLGSLTDEQLKLIVNSTDQRVPGEVKKAAKLLLEPVPEATIHTYLETYPGIVIPALCTGIELYRIISK
jgi:hypothetical protein